MPDVLLNVLQRFDGVVRAFLVLNACQRLLDIDGKGKGLVDQGIRGRNFFRRSRCCGEAVPAAVSPNAREAPDRSAEYKRGTRKAFILFF